MSVFIFANLGIYCEKGCVTVWCVAVGVAWVITNMSIKFSPVHSSLFIGICITVRKEAWCVCARVCTEGRMG